MLVKPDCQLKPLSECDAGKLVRIVGQRYSGEFALVADANEKKERALILLKKEHGPQFFIESHPDQLIVLAYNERVILEVDHHGPFEPRARHLYEMPGCLIRESTRWLLNVVPVANARFRFDRAQYDLEASKIVQVSDELTNIAIFGQWSIYLGDEDAPREDRIMIATFKQERPKDQQP